MEYCIVPLTSSFSFRYGVEAPEALASAVAAGGFAAGILSDFGTVSGQLRFRAACKAAGVTAGAGATLEVGGMTACFIALEGGWPDLCRLITSVHSPGRVSLEEALGTASGLMMLAQSPSEAAGIRKMGFTGRTAVVVLPYLFTGLDPLIAETAALEAGERPMACWPAVFAVEGSRDVHRILRTGYLAIERKKPGLSDYAPVCAIVPDRRRFEESFRTAPRSLEANAELAAAIPATPPCSSTIRRRDPDLEDRLRAMVLERLPGFYGESPSAAGRASEELDAVCGNGLAGYFLHFSDIVERCREKGIAVAARGSAGGSLLSYVLGLSIVCPIRHGLSFSRFFNRLRSSPPDIDLDIDSSRRDQVMEWFLERVGRRGAAVSQVVTHRIRSAFRVAASGLGMGQEEMDALSKLIRRRRNPAWESPQAVRAIREAELLKGIPSHLAPHPCGLVCADGPVDLMVPVQPSPNGYFITQFDKDGVEEIGLLKMDLLGQRGLTTMSTACRSIGCGPEVLFRKGGSLPEDARELLDSGRCIGVVHVESPAMRGLMREMSIRTMEDVARALALVRPGASAGGGRKIYLERLRSGSFDCGLLPELRSLLRENRGVMLYQEDVSMAAEVLLGMDEAGGDLLRRRLKKKQVPREEVIAACRRRGFPPKKAEAAWEMLSGYAGYGFCKAHAFTYGSIACAAAALKSRMPAVYMAAVMAAGGGFYDPRVYVEEARRMGVRFDPPGVNSGRWLTFEREGRIVAGFHFVKGMGKEEFQRLVRGRPYSRPSDLIAAGCGPALCRNLAAAGCFRELGSTPPASLMQMETGECGLFPGHEPDVPDLPDYSLRVRVAMELGVLGLPLTTSPLSLETRPAGCVPISSLPVSGPVNLWGRSVTGRRLTEGAGFLMLEDDTGTADVFLPSPLFFRAEDILARPEATLAVAGTVERAGRVKALSVEEGPLTVRPSEPESPE
jgi:error-prone DNA polymerase